MVRDVFVENQLLRLMGHAGVGHGTRRVARFTLTHL